MSNDVKLFSTKRLEASLQKVLEKIEIQRLVVTSGMMMMMMMIRSYVTRTASQNLTDRDILYSSVAKSRTGFLFADKSKKTLWKRQNIDKQCKRCVYCSP